MNFNECLPVYTVHNVRVCVYVYIAAPLQSIFSLSWECSRKKDALVKLPWKHAADSPLGNYTNGYLLDL